MTAPTDLRGVRIAVTGATGFLGRYITEALLDRGARVIGVVRNPSRVPALAAMGAELRSADLADPARLRQGFAGADALVSNAALLSLGRTSWEEFRQANVDGTKNVLEAAHAAGVRRIVQVSSVAAYGLRVRGRVDEEAPLLREQDRRTPFHAYPVSKALSERLAWDLAEAHGLALTSVRPCTIYGAFDPTFMPVFRALLRPPVSVMPAFAHLSFVYAGDVADGIARALERPASAGRAYNLAGDGESAWEFLRAWQAAGGRIPRLVLPLPLPWASRYDTSRARTELGWRPCPLVVGLRDTLRREAVA